MDMSIADGGKKLVVVNRGVGKFWANIAVEAIYRLTRLRSDNTYKSVKRLGSYQFIGLSPRVEYVLPSANFLGRIPRRQIILTNHTIGMFKDAFSMFPLIPEHSRLIVVQHDFNPIITLISPSGWGAWTINKDDKTTRGKNRLLRRLEELLKVMRLERDLTVVMFGTGKVPKTSSQSRNPERIYPGSVYLSLMSGYPITLFLNDVSPIDETYRAIVKEPMYLLKEYQGRVVNFPTIQEFKDHPGNKEVIEEVCERLRKMSLEEYEGITKIETQWTTV
jgi:hypothetical protein